MITITIWRKKLEALGACPEGIVVFDDIMRAQGRKKSVRVRDWTPLHSAWLGAVYPSFAKWLFDHNLLHSTSTSGQFGTSTSGYRGTSTSGYLGTSTSGNYGTSTSGYRGTSTSGDYGTSTSGDRGESTSGYRGTSTSGDYGTSTSGYRGTSTSGDYGTSTSGDYGTSTSGDYGIIVCRWYDGFRYLLTVGYVGKNGVLPNVAYKCNAKGKLVRA